jgi:carboxymethylenebutenolidase
MDQRIINLYDEYTHAPLKREEFLRKLALLTGSMAAALGVLPLIEVNYAHAATVSEQDLFTEEITYDGVNGKMSGYIARPKANRTYGGVMVIHENRGLNPHIRDVTRRMAQAGFLALAPDALAPFGGTPSNEDSARAAFSKIQASENLQNFLLGFDYMKKRKDCSGKLGCVGFCWGGAMGNQMAVNYPDLKAAVAYYGRQAAAADVPKIKAAVQLHYAGLDERVNAGIAEYETALKSAGTKYELYIYDGVNHAFNNDTAPTRYNADAAKLAWERTLEFFRKNLA